MILYHGTSYSNWLSIQKEGVIKPRGTGPGNWTVQSRPDCVYLTNCYAAYFAQSTGEKELAIIEVELDEGDGRLLPDEDFLEQATRGSVMLDLDMEERTKYYRENLEEYQSFWIKSIKYLGTCCYKGSIDLEKCTRVGVFTMGAWLLAESDPTITLANKALVGHRYINNLQRMFSGTHPHITSIIKVNHAAEK